MGAYYYFVAQLPNLIYGQEPPMSSAAFLDLARSQMDGEDRAFLDQVGLDPATGLTVNPGLPAYAENAPALGCDFIDGWREWERSLRLNLARTRAARIKREGGATVEPPIVPADAVNTAQQAATTAESPLEAEEFLDKARWTAIERLQGIPYFSRNTVYAYLLKLLILERYASFKAEVGFAEYKSLYASILERAQPGARLQSSPVGEPK